MHICIDKVMLESIRILSIVAMFAGVFGIAFKLTRYVYLCVKPNQRVVIEANRYEGNEVRQFQPLETRHPLKTLETVEPTPPLEQVDIVEEVESPISNRPNSPNISGRHIGKPIRIVTKVFAYHNHT